MICCKIYGGLSIVQMVCVGVGWVVVGCGGGIGAGAGGARLVVGWLSSSSSSS